MNDNDRRRYEMLVKANQFGIDNSADFPLSTIAPAKFAQLTTKVNAAESKSASQQAGFSEAAQQFEVKDTRRENLRDQMSAISRTSKSMEYVFDGIADKFKFQRNLTDEALLAKARAFIIEGASYDANFVSYGMPATFVADLTAAADAFEQSFGETASASAEHIAATADVSADIREGMVIVRTLDGVVKNIYANNPGKLAAWASASHVEKPPKAKEPPPTP